MKIKFIKSEKAFTLSEVLITLAIIGVVAALTVPSLVAKQQEKSTVVALKKTYSTLSNAFDLAVRENGTPDTWGLVAMGDSTGLARLNNIMSPYLKIQKNCGTGVGCFPNKPYLDLNNVEKTNLYTFTGSSKLILNDGTLVSLRQLSGDCAVNYGSSSALRSVCGMFSVDINGLKGPSQIGVDYFSFFFTKNGLIPVGLQAQTTYPHSDFCNKSKSSIVGWHNGLSCSAWVLHNENMEYLKCNNLSWTGKATCN